MESLLVACGLALVGIAVVYMVLVGRKRKPPYDEETQSQIMALRAHVEAREKNALQGIERRAQKQADRRRAQRMADKGASK
ncbi:hypothetical protein os1_36870 [Comamonadaceae bacterium OS-1]|nr:hypothetical protein os1_36870 [Comamonadaceae bacterium OS-1]